MAASTVAPRIAQPEGFYCSTSGTVIQDRDELARHYQSEFHRYNLKRKVAGLPPVTKEWFEARRAQLVGSQAVASQGLPPGHIRVWFDPLLRKTFRSEQTYLAHTKSNKYLEAVRKSGQPAPPPVISVKKLADSDATAESVAGDGSNKAAPKQSQLPSTSGFTVVKPSGGLPLRTEDGEQASSASPTQDADDAISEGDEEGSGWETASDDDALAEATAGMSLAEGGDGEEEGDMPEWDVRRSLFDNHMSESFEANLEYMWRKFGFYLPDAEYLTDPEGLVQYLGAKLQIGRVPLYTRGDDANAKQFRSLHAVQRHMVDSGRCKMLYDDNEEEYEEYYDYGAEEDEQNDEGKELAVAPAGAALVAGGYELIVPSADGAATKVLGTREFARYYRQRHRLADERQSVVVNAIQARYRSLGISLQDDAQSLEQKKLKSKSWRDHKWEGKRNEGLFMRGNINRNLPKNVPY